MASAPVDIPIQIKGLSDLQKMERRMEALERAASSGRAEPAMLEDEARSLRSQIRMWGKDGERYADSGDSWLSWLDGLGRNL